MPIPASVAPCESTSCSTFRGCAPSASRTASSRVRCVTMAVITPKIPTAESASAIIAKMPSSEALKRCRASEMERTVSIGRILPSV